jgi:hypothetical protein
MSFQNKEYIRYYFEYTNLLQINMMASIALFILNNY